AQGIEAGPWWDPMLVAQVLEGGQHLKEEGYFTLEAVAARYLGRTLDKVHQTSDWRRPFLSEAQLHYAADDVLTLLDLVPVLMDAVTKERLTETVALEMAALPTMAWMTHTGVPFDAVRWEQLADQAEARRTEVAEVLQQQFADALDGRTGHLPGMVPPVNLDSPVKMKQAFQDLGLTVEDTDEDTLVAVQEQCPLIPIYLRYREAQKQASTYGREFLRYRHPVTGRIHPGYYQIGTETGRMSCSKPNMQNIPRLASYRACICPGLGKVLVKADLSMIELCVAAELSRDTALIQALVARQDPYRLTASAVFQRPLTEVTSQERSFGKTVVLGMLFGMGAQTLQDKAREAGMEISLHEAQHFIGRFGSAWPALARYRQKRLALRRMRVRSVAGRVRKLLPDAKGTLRLNTPIRATAADGFKAAMGLLWQERHQHPGVAPILAVHDELVLECDSAQGEETAAWVSSCLERGMRRYLTQAPVRIQTVIARDWSGGE
nr:DNA polymerase [Candidatus Tectomicrobia bacterium]